MEKRWYYLVTPLAYTGQANGFTYHFDSELQPGRIVVVPVGRRLLTGVVSQAVDRPEFATKSINRAVDLPAIPADLLTLAGWIMSYYAASPASVWTTLLPTGITKQRREATAAKPKAAAGLPAVPLSDEQTAALDRIRRSALTSYLLQGVTGSGKTRLYLELTAETLAAGRSVIILVPEITLTSQIVDQFETAFGDVVIASHSKLTEAKRHLLWTEALAAAGRQQPRIIVGPRSCLFLPVHDLGLIVVDECHESSYKQDQHPRYHAVTAAARRARDTASRLILGSATPGLAELFLAQSGRLEHIFLTKRVNNLPRPQAQIIDIRDKELFKLSKYIAQPLVDAVADTLAQKRQSLLYLNRRGSASSQVCADCGHITTCPHCQLPLTFHADLMRLICHHCNFRQVSPAVCPECNGSDLKLLGGGTKRIEAEIGRLFPSARIARLDRDSATLRHIQQVLRDLKSGALDIVIGTQMIAKGLDLPAIDTVGIVNADTMLHLPDFTAAERTYQLLSQVSGRAGRGDRPGRVYIQTYTPEHPAITAAAFGSFEDFATPELAERRNLGYPPYVYLLKLTLAASTADAARTEATRLAQQLRLLPEIAVTGPAPAFLEIQAGKYRWIIAVAAKRRAPLAHIATSLPSDRWTADLDPINLL